MTRLSTTAIDPQKVNTDVSEPGETYHRPRKRYFPCSVLAHVELLIGSPLLSSQDHRKLGETGSTLRVAR